MSDSAPRVCGEGPRRWLVPRPLGGDVAPLWLGAAGPANVNCGWVRRRRSGPRGRSDGVRGGLIVDFYNGAG